MTITEFLEARIAEDEAALKAVPVAAQQSDDFDFGGTDDYLRFTMGYGRAVAECAAKRAIIVRAQEATEVEQEFDDRVWAGAGPERAEPWAGDAILFALAAVYKDHPDYQQEWAG
jgi:hypothetical protein